MRAYRFTHLSDVVLLRGLAAQFTRVDTEIAVLLAYIAEVDARRLYLPAGYSSMYAYCVGEFRRPEQTTFKLIRVARTARKFPAILRKLGHRRIGNA